MVIAAVILYFAVILGASLALSRKGSSSDFFRGSGRSPWPVVAIAMVGTSISGVTFVSVPGMVAASEFSYLQMALGFISGYAVIAYVLLPLYYSRRMNSLYCYVEERFGAWSYHTSAAFFLLSKVLGCGVKMYLTATVLQLVLFAPLGIPFWLNIALTMLIVYLYTFRGGVRTLVWTDMLQTLCLLGAVVLSIVFIGKGMGLDIGGICSTVRDSGMTRMWFFDDPASARYFWKMVAGGALCLVAMTGLDQDMMQRNLSCRTKRDSQINIVLTALCQIVVILLFLALGALIYIYIAREGLPQPAKGDQAFALVAVQGGLPKIAGIMFVVGLVSCTYSAAGSALTALTTSFTLDIMHGGGNDEQRLERLRKRTHVAMAAVITTVILIFDRFGNDSVINLVFKVAGYTYGPILGLFVFGLATRRDIRQRFVPFIAVTAPVASYLLQWWAAEKWGYAIGFELLGYNALFCIFGLFLISHPRNETAS